jgi:PhnB protein
MVNAIPTGYPRLSPYLVVEGAAEAIEFYRSVLGATERLRLAGPDGRIGHAELLIGDALVMLADEFPDMGHHGPRSLGGSPVTLQLYVDDADDVVERAQAAGSKLLRPVESQFYGDRSGQFEDPFGHRWSVATHVEDVDPDERARRAAAVAEETS